MVGTESFRSESQASLNGHLLLSFPFPPSPSSPFPPTRTPTSSSSSDHQQQLSILQDEIATLKAQKERLARIATQTLSVLRAQPLAVRPKGIWIQEGDQAQMEKMEGSLVQLDAGKAWRWAEVRTFALWVGRRREAGRKGGKLQLVDPPSRLTSTVSPPCCPKVNHIASSATKYSLISTPSVYTKPRPEITPFRRFFPLESLEAGHRRPLQLPDKGHLRSIESRVLGNLRS